MNIKYNIFLGRYNTKIQQPHAHGVVIGMRKNGKYNSAVQQKYNKWGEVCNSYLTIQRGEVGVNGVFWGSEIKKAVINDRLCDSEGIKNDFEFKHIMSIDTTKIQQITK